MAKADAADGPGSGGTRMDDSGTPHRGAEGMRAPAPACILNRRRKTHSNQTHRCLSDSGKEAGGRHRRRPHALGINVAKSPEFVIIYAFLGR